MESRAGFFSWLNWDDPPSNRTSIIICQVQGSCSTEVEITFEPRSVCIESSSEEKYQRDGDIYLHSGNVPNIADTWKMGGPPGLRKDVFPI